MADKMSVNFNDFNNMSAQQTSGNRVGRAPQNWNVYLKHDARSGHLSMLINSNDPQNDDYQTVDLKEAEFASIIILTSTSTSSNFKGSNSINSTMTAGNVVNVSKTDMNNNYVSLGLYQLGGRSAAEGLRTQYRVYGILRSVNGQAPSKTPEINAAFGNNAVPVMMDLTYSKYHTLLNEANASSANQITGANAKFIKIEEDTHTSHEVTIRSQNQHVKLFDPKFTVSPVSEESQQKMAAYAEAPMESLMTFMKEIQKRDKFFQLLFQAGKSGEKYASIVNDLAGQGVTDVDSLKKHVEQIGGWANLGAAPAMPTNNNTAAEHSPSAAPAKPEPADTKQADDDFNAENPFADAAGSDADTEFPTDDNLPF